MEILLCKAGEYWLSDRHPATLFFCPRANGASRRSGRKPGARVTNFVLGELKVIARVVR